MTIECRIVLVNLTDPPSGWVHDVNIFCSFLASLGCQVLDVLGWHELPTAQNRYADLNIYIEELPPESSWYKTALSHWFVLNQDIRHDRSNYRYMNRIICKSKFAHTLVTELDGGRHAHLGVYTGFTTPDRWGQSVDLLHGKRFDRVLFVPGKAPEKKQAELVWRTWQNNPHFPQLTCVVRASYSLTTADLEQWKLPNFEVLTEWVEEDVLSQLQRICGIHLCVSKSEGFGHQLNESRGAGSLAVTLDAPPMNELVDETIGILIPSYPEQGGVETFPGATMVCAKPRDLATAVEYCLALSLARKREMALLARKRYIKSRQIFYDNLKAGIESLGL